jgi:TolB-like protein/class 3 adenylate cyclase/Flp pilus assembly protein TadD
MSDAGEQRKLAAIMFTDMVGYSALSQRDDKLALELLEEHRDILRKIFPEFNGTEIKTIGDAFLVEFSSALEAAQCAIAIQRALAKRNADAAADRQIQVKIGIHIGDVVHRGGDVYGDGVNIASRIEPLAGAGGICVSMDVERQIRNAVETRFEKLAPTELKNISVPMELFRIVLPWERKSEVTSQRSEVRKSGVALSHSKIWSIAVLVLLAVGIGWWWTTRPHKTLTPRQSASAARTEAASAIPQKSIAVLPLLNESGDPKDEYFSDGLSEELIAALAQIRDLKVIGRSSSFRFKDRKEEPKTIGEKLGVATLLEGTVRKQGDRVRIVAELINAADGIELWTRTFDRELKDIFAVQQEIAGAVADSLKVTLLGSNEKTAQMASNSVEAHNAYLQAHFHFQRRNVEDYRKSIPYYDQAIQLDPDYALAYAERSEVWTIIGDLTGERSTAYPKARSDAEKAVAIAPTLAEAHAALGWVRAFAEWKFAEGLSELQRAKEISPANPTTNDLLARVIVYRGRMEEAEDQARQAVELDPLSAAAQFTLGRVLFYAGKLHEADAAGRKMAELQPSASSSHRWQVLVAVQRGDGETALREAQLEPDESIRAFELALAQYVRGDRKAADAALADLITNSRDSLAYQIAEIYAMRHETDKAFEWLQVAFDNHDGGMPSLLVDPLLQNLRDDPRYKALIAKMNLPTT